MFIGILREHYCSRLRKWMGLLWLNVSWAFKYTRAKNYIRRIKLVMRHNWRKVRNFYFIVLPSKGENSALLSTSYISIIYSLYMSIKFENNEKLTYDFRILSKQLYYYHFINIFLFAMHISDWSQFRVNEENCAWRTLNNSWPQGIINIKASFFLQLHVWNENGCIIQSKIVILKFLFLKIVM